jgi:hypothetical protein
MPTEPTPFSFLLSRIAPDNVIELAPGGVPVALGRQTMVVFG